MEFNATFLISTISFILFVIIMNAIFYRPLRLIAEKRNLYIGDNYNVADSVNSKAKEILEDKVQQISKVQRDSREHISKNVELSKQKKSDMINSAVVSSKEKISAEKDSLSKEKSNANEVLKTHVYDLSKNISEKVLGQEINDLEYNHNIVDEAMNNA